MKIYQGFRYLIWTILMIHWLPLYSAKIHPDAGTTSMAFLKIPVGARYASLGGSIICDFDDLSVSFYNPSFLSGFSKRKVYISHNFHFSDISQSYFAFGNATKNILSQTTAYYVISLNYLKVSGLERRSGFYESDPFSPSPVEGIFSSEDLSLSLSYGFKYKDYFNAGVSLKYLFERISNKNASTFAIDLGVNRSLNFNGILYNLEAALSNTGGKVRFENEGYKLPSSMRFGLWRSFERYNIKSSFTILKYIDNYPYFIIAAEKKINQSLYIRAAYRLRLNGNEPGGWAGFSSGIGIIYNKFYFDYSLNPYGELGYSHKISLSFDF